MTYYLDGDGTQLMVFAIAECLTGGNYNRFTSMYAERIEVLHVADSDAVVVFVAHHLILYLLPSLERLFDKHLWRERECFFCLLEQLLFIIAEARPKSSEGVCCTQDNRIAEVISSLLHLFDSVACLTLYRLDIYLIETFYEQVTVLCVDDGLNRSSHHLHIILAEHTPLV